MASKGFFDSPQPDQPDSRAIVKAMVSWHINVVRLPLNEDCWLGVNAPSAFSGTRYQRAIALEVERLNAAGLYVILDLHWTAPGSTKAIGQEPMPDASHALAFWASVATVFRQDGMVVFDAFNEPFGVTWHCWREGCPVHVSGFPVYQAVGMQQIVNTIREVGDTQPIMLTGLNSGRDLTQFSASEPSDPSHAIIASAHLYGMAGANDKIGCVGACRSVLVTLAGKVPVVFGELGETDCQSGYMQQTTSFADRHQIGYVAWAWNPTDFGWSCSKGPSLVSNFAGAPTPYGAGFKAHLAALSAQRLRSGSGSG